MQIYTMELRWNKKKITRKHIEHGVLMNILSHTLFANLINISFRFWDLFTELFFLRMTKANKKERDRENRRKGRKSGREGERQQ